MPLIDDRGRLFGRINLLDAVVGLVVLGLIPLGYVAYGLFRVPLPTVTAIEPAQIVEHQQGTVVLHGKFLRPFLHVRFNYTDAPVYMVQTTDRAVVQLPDLPPGTYAVSLHDEAAQLVSVPGLLTVVPARSAVQVVGMFESAAENMARAIKAGTTFDLAGAPPDPAAPVGEALAVRPPLPGVIRINMGNGAFVQGEAPGTLRVPAIVRLKCAVHPDGCRVGGTPLNLGGNVTLVPRVASGGAAPDPSGLVFQIEAVRASNAPVDTAVARLRVRFTMPASTADAIEGRRDDRSTGGTVLQAMLVGSGYDRQTLPWRVVTDMPGRSVLMTQPLTAVTWEVRVPVVPAGAAWTYQDQPVRVGAPFRIDTPNGPISGVVVEMTLSGDNPITLK